MNIEKLAKDAAQEIGSVTSLSKALGVSRVTAHAWISGKVEPSLENVISMVMIVDGKSDLTSLYAYLGEAKSRAWAKFSMHKFGEEF